MKWFKHMTCSFNDEKLSSVVDELGMEGYGFWWRILEVVAEKLDESGDCSCTFSSKKWGDFFGFSAKKFEKFAGFFGKKGMFFVEFSEKSVTVKIPNLLKYKDEWSRKKSKNSGVTPDELRSKEEDIEEEYINTPPLPPTGGNSAGCFPEPEPQGEQAESHAGEKPCGCSRTAGEAQGSGAKAKCSSSSRSGGNSAADLKAFADEYTQCPELRQALEDFRVMRERMRKPLTVKALKLTCGDLDKFAGGNDALKVAILDQSVQRGWQGVFQLREDSKPKADPWAGAI